jgi:hypothetical protein
MNDVSLSFLLLTSHQYRLGVRNISINAGLDFQLSVVFTQKEEEKKKRRSSPRRHEEHKETQRRKEISRLIFLPWCLFFFSFSFFVLLRAFVVDFLLFLFYAIFNNRKPVYAQCYGNLNQENG